MGWNMYYEGKGAFMTFKFILSLVNIPPTHHIIIRIALLPPKPRGSHLTRACFSSGFSQIELCGTFMHGVYQVLRPYTFSQNIKSGAVFKLGA